jgi:pyruvate/2-oxoglutarate dehydrogenase complex dihydrolipoamide dehydrogenase (E3) component
MDRDFDVICVGAGPCGEAVAAELRGSGLSLAMVEADLVGGECPYWGCIPSKTMIRNAETLKEADRARGLAASRVEYDVDFGKSAQRTLYMARDLDDSNPAKAITDGGASLLRGAAAILAADRVEVDGVALKARRAVVVASGSRAAPPPISGLDKVDYWTNREAVLARELPGRLAVIGGGAVGVELAQAFARFGTRVAVLQGVERLIPAEEPEAGDLLRKHLERDGITVITGARVTGVEPGLRVLLEGGQPVESERLLVATGRRPNLDGFDLPASGLHTSERGWLEVEPETLAAGERVWAGGDVTGIAGFTHVAHYHGTLIGRRLRGQERPANHVAVPRVTFTDPEVASVGLTEAQAKAQGINVRVASADAANSARGYIHDFQDGLVKLVADLDRRVLVGATIVSPRAGEMIHELVLALRAEVPLPVLADTIHAFPTFSRVLQGVLDELR